MDYTLHDSMYDEAAMYGGNRGSGGYPSMHSSQYYSQEDPYGYQGYYSAEYGYDYGWVGGSGYQEASGYPAAASAPPQGVPGYAAGGKGKGHGPGGGKGWSGVGGKGSRGAVGGPAPPQNTYQYHPNWDPLIGISIVVNYFRTHLLLRDFRPTGPQAGHPQAEACLQDFEKFVQYVAYCHREQGPLDLTTFETLCRKFSSEWEGVCHWLNHKILSSFLTKKVNITWR